MARPVTSYAINGKKLKSKLVLTGYTIKEASMMCHYDSNWLSQCIWKERMSEDGIKQIEQNFGIKRSTFVYKPFDGARTTGGAK